MVMNNNDGELCSIGLLPHEWKRVFYDSTTDLRCAKCKASYYKKDLEEFYHNVDTCPECNNELKPEKHWRRVCKKCGEAK